MLVQIVSWWAFVLTASAASLFVLALFPHRHARASRTAAAVPWRSVCVGMPLTIVPLVIFLSLAAQREEDWVPSLLLLLMLGCCVGLGVCGRAIGTRLLPARPACWTTALGTALIGLTAAFPQFGAIVVVVATSVGVGAFIHPLPDIGDPLDGD